MCNALKQEEDALAVGGKLGRTNNTFAFEEKMINRDLKFSTNKIKREKEMSKLKTGKEGLRMGVFESGTLKEGSEEREEGKILKVGLDLSNSEETVDGQALQRSLDEIRKEKCDISGELTNLKSINMKRGELKKEIEELKDLTIEVVKAKKGEVSKKIKLGAVAVEALIDPENMRRYNLHAEVERTGSDLKGDGVDVVMKGTEQAVKKMDKLLRELTSTYLVMPLKQSEQSVLTTGEGLLLEQIRRRTGAAIGFKDGKLYIFGQEKERLEAKAVVKQELKLCTSSPWRRWSFLRKSSVVG